MRFLTSVFVGMPYYRPEPGLRRLLHRPHVTLPNQTTVTLCGCSCGRINNSNRPNWDFTKTRPFHSYPGKNKSYFITTPIFYVNAEPHIGHLYSALLADAASRWHRLLGNDVIFSTGTDEHGLKIQQAAAKQNKPPQQFCDSISNHFKRLFDLASIEHTDYIRTTDEAHKSAVNHLWNVLYDGGHIYPGLYEGWYSVSDEAFLTPDDVMEKINSDGRKMMVAIESGNMVEWMSEKNYMFRLSDFGDELLKWLDTGAVQPSVFEGLVRKWITEGLPDLSVSRQRDRLSWGISVPNDPTHTVYVWLDALTNYLTVGGYPRADHTWPADCHVVGKDILKFHAVYWPAFLIAAGLPPPRSVFCHSHWTLDHHKMSKSRGNVVDPFDQLERYTVDGMRYFLLSEGVPHSDGNYSEKRLVECVNSQLGNTLGNLLSRCTASSLNPQQHVPAYSADVADRIYTAHDKKMITSLKQLPDMVAEQYESLHFYKGLDLIMSQLRDTNAFVQHHKPWELKNSADRQEELSGILSIPLETLRITALLLQPIVPGLASQILDRLNVPTERRSFADTGSCVESTAPRPLGPDMGNVFPRIKT